MRKLLVFATLISLFGAVHAASCIIEGDTLRSCSDEGSATAEIDIRSGGVLDGLCEVTEEEPFEGRGWTFCLSNVLTFFNCLARPGFSVLIR